MLSRLMIPANLTPMQSISLLLIFFQNVGLMRYETQYIVQPEKKMHCTN